MKNQIFYCVLFVLWGFCAHTGKAQNTFPFQNPDLSFEKRVDDLDGTQSKRMHKSQP